MSFGSSLLAGILLGGLNLYLLRETLDRFLTGAPSNRSAAWASLLGMRMLLIGSLLVLSERFAGADFTGCAAGLIVAYTAFKVVMALRRAHRTRVYER